MHLLTDQLLGDESVSEIIAFPHFNRPFTLYQSCLRLLWRKQCNNGKGGKKDRDISIRLNRLMCFRPWDLANRIPISIISPNSHLPDLFDLYLHDHSISISTFLHTTFLHTFFSVPWSPRTYTGVSCLCLLLSFILNRGFIFLHGFDVWILIKTPAFIFPFRL